jgi:hypothetical protein
MSNQFDLRCPKCQSEDGVTIQIPIWVLLTHDGTDADTPQDHEWDDNSPTTCAACHFDGKVADFTPASSTLTEYMAYFRTTAGPANDIYQAQTPEQILRIAQEIFDRDDESLGFTPGDAPELQEIRIVPEDAEEVLVWQSDEYRLQLAAPKLLEALEKQAEATRGILDACDEMNDLSAAGEDIIQAIDGIIEDLEGLSEAAGGLLVSWKNENSQLAAAVRDLQDSLTVAEKTITDAKGGEE